MTICQLMIMDFKGILEGIAFSEAYDEYDLEKGITYCDGWMEIGFTRDEIGDFNLQDLKDWCIKKLIERRQNKWS